MVPLPHPGEVLARRPLMRELYGTKLVTKPGEKPRVVVVPPPRARRAMSFPARLAAWALMVLAPWAAIITCLHLIGLV